MFHSNFLEHPSNSSYTGDVMNKSRNVLRWWNNSIFAGRYHTNPFFFSAVLAVLYLDGVRAEVFTFRSPDLLTQDPAQTCCERFGADVVSPSAQLLHICAWEGSWTENPQLIKRSSIFRIPKEVDKQV